MGAPVIWSGNNAKSLKANLDLSGESLISNGTFAAANNLADQNVLTIDPSTVRSASIVMSVVVDATADLYENYILNVINKAGTTFEMSQNSVGDDSLVTFAITTAGVIQVTTPSYAGFASCTLKYTTTQVYI